MADFQLVSSFKPQGDQQQAIDELLDGLRRGERFQTFLGVTGSGKTFVMANVIAKIGLPTLIMSHNKTLAAQLYGEFKSFFPHNAAEFFISYYDYYQPEAYLPHTDTYIEKETDVNEEIDRLRLKATTSLMERDDVVIVASVSSIYGLGSPKDYRELLLFLQRGEDYDRREMLKRLVDMHYVRNDVGFPRGSFRVRGDVVEIHPAYEETAIRVEFFGDTIERITTINILSGNVLREQQRAAIYPAKHFITSIPNLQRAMKDIRKELDERVEELRTSGKLLEAQRLEQRTRYDLEMMAEVGYCSGIENYSRHLAARAPGERPACLFDYFPDEFLLIVDESHVSVPQIRAMYRGDRHRKETLVEYGFRLPSALDNRPMFFEEWENISHRCIFASATPGDYEIEKSKGVIVEQIIRPTGLLDPPIDVRPIKGQVDDLVSEIRETVERGERVLALTLTKRISEDLTEYLKTLNIKVRYLHSEVMSLDRVDILRDLRLKNFDVLVGINLLREGLDLPEVSLVAILDADQEGFLRSRRSLMQIAGRAARNVAGRVIFYADKITDSMKYVIDETTRRRDIQRKYNEEHNITPESITKSVEDILRTTVVANRKVKEEIKTPKTDYMTVYDIENLISRLEKEMRRLAKSQEFEEAAKLRDEINRLKEKLG